MLQIQSFHARVADDAISKVTRLFNATLDDIFAELIQNARRAGAKLVSIDEVEHDRLGPAIRISDDGPGIDDPRSLFTLGQSAWGDATIMSEDAAGMGFFALAGRRISLIVQEAGAARSWTLDADPTAFKGEAPITCTPGPGHHTGMTVFVEARSNESVVTAANRAALYCPIEVKVEGVLAERKDFLERADHIETWNGIRIGLYDQAPISYCRKHNVNFHGVTLRASLPQVTQSFHREYHVRLDVIDCARLKLVLPARKEIVADVFFETLQHHIREVMYRRIADAGAHSLSFSEWSEARSLGVDLPPASMLLRPFSPAQADREMGQGHAPEPVTPESLLFDGDDDPVEEQNLALALSGHESAPMLYEPNGSFNGYAWYDALPCLAISGYRLCRSEKEERFAPGETTSTDVRPDRLFIEGQIGTVSDLIPWELETDVLVLGSGDCCDLDEVDLCVAATSTLTHDDLVDLLTRALFCPSDDVDAGCYDDQQRWFTDYAEDRVIRFLESDVEANVNAVIRVISRELYWLRKPDADVTIRILDDEITVSGLDTKAGL